MAKQSLLFRDLIDVNTWQKIQDNFSLITGIGICTVDPKGKLLTNISGEPRLYAKLAKTHKQMKLFCGLCLPTFLNGNAVVDKNLSYSCEAGLTYFVVPLRLDDGNDLGYVILGPVVLIRRKSKEEYETAAEELNINIEEFWDALLEIKVVSLQVMQSLVAFVEVVSRHFINLTYKNILKQEELSSDPGPSKLKNVLNILLEVAFDSTKADFGSVMFIDKSKENLTIQASKGIPDDIAKNTRVRIGDGIAGMAASDGHSFLIDENTRNNRIEPYLSRPDISSSMVIPIKVKKRVVGVMNLGTLKTSAAKFDPDNFQDMNKLVDLVSRTISLSV